MNHSHWRRFGHIVPLVVFGTVATALFLCQPPETQIHSDTIRDWSTARLFVDGSQPLAVGPTASFPGMRQGGAWYLHVRMMQALGVPLLLLPVFSVLLAALASTIVFIGASHIGGRGAGLIAALIMAVPLVLDPSRVYLQWNPTLVPLPAAILVLAVVGAVRDGAAIHYVVAACALSFLGSLHGANYVLLLPALVVFVISPPRRRPAIVLLFSALLFLASQVCLSLDALLYNLETVLGSFDSQVFEGAPTLDSFSKRSWIFPIVTAAAWWAIRKDFRLETRVVDSLAALIIPSSLLVIGIAAAGDVDMEFRYIGWLTPGLSVLCGLAAARGLSRLRALLHRWMPGERWVIRHGSLPIFVLVLALHVMFRQTHPEPRDWVSLEDTIHLSRFLPDLGIHNYEDALCRLRGPQSSTILNGLSTQEGFFPWRRSEGETCPHAQTTQLIWVERVGEPSWRSSLAGTTVVREGDDGALFLIPFQTALDWNRMEVSVEREDTGWTAWQPTPFLSGEAFHPGYPTLFTIPREWSGGLRLRIPVALGDQPIGLSPACDMHNPCSFRIYTEPDHPVPSMGNWTAVESPTDTIVVEWTYEDETQQPTGLSPPILEATADVIHAMRSAGRRSE